ncbi:helix-turn-helix transcriptional regulator [Phycicoccus sp. DTK01]|uniref:helix-turn-helix transcriptional regulator n=1 Tax=Phycicoccus sp. DTK01 TaxID=2785745 RepID=UPI001A8CBFDF|nr:helix-turn-helix transcriptional regulator [Phycicoccus sp. DTK01]GIL36842.1 helix-turn-helix transcriptional regulator [Phycicoccus sp. DTK01]
MGTGRVARPGRWRSLRDRLEESLAPTLEPTVLAERVYAAVAAHAPYDFACLAFTDPASGVVTWASKTRSLGVGDEEFSASEYGGPDVNKLADLARRDPPVGALWVDTDGRPETCRRHREFMHPRFGFTDELRAVFVSRGASWGALGVYRGPGDPPFTQAEADELGAACPTIASAIRRSLFRPVPATGPTGPTGPADPGVAVVVVDDADRPTLATPGTQAAIEQLGGLESGSLPASVLAVVATTRAGGEPFQSQVRTTDGRWLSVRAAPLTPGGPTDLAPAGRIVVSIDAAPRSAVSRMALAAHGLSRREEDVAVLVLQGLDTRAIAASLHLSPHTVQDHLKSVFAKLGVSSRRELTARLVLE